MQIRLLGPVSLGGDDGTLYVGGPKERTVLAVLAIHEGTTVPEDRLVAALWPQDPPRTAPRTLQAYISRLRRVLQGTDGPIRIEAVHGGYRLLSSEDGIDVHAVEATAKRARDALAAGDPAGAAGMYDQSLASWEGEPLGEFADEEWARPTASRLVELQKTLYEERVDAYLACGRHALLIGELEAACRADPFRERLWAQRMTALYRSGRQADALAVGRELRRRLADDLGVEPSPDLKVLERAILTQDGALEPPAPPDAPQTQRLPFPHGLDVIGPAAFVGRSDELAALHACWDAAAAGATRSVFVGGEPGIGKSRLVGEFARGLHDAGFTVLFGACEEDLNVAYQPFAEALRPFVAAAPIELLRDHVRNHGGEIARLLPEITNRITDIPPPLAAEPEAERYRLFEAVAALIESVARTTPVLLVLDDLQWATKPTLLLLRHLLRQQRRIAAMVIGLYRATETSDILTDTLADLRRSPDVDRLVLDGLRSEHVIAFVEAIAGAEIDADGREFATRLQEETAGSPFFVGEVLRHLVETGAIAEGRGQWTTPDISTFDLPASVREVVGRRVGRLSQATRDVLTLASVIGPAFSLTILERSDGLQGEPLLDAVEEAVVAGMVRDVNGAPGSYTFAHALVRRALYDAPSVLRRARMHRRVAEALEEDPTADISEVAMHYLAAAADGVAEKAIMYAARAGNLAHERVAYDEAVRFHEKALEVAEWAGMEGSTTTCDLLLGLADALWKVGEVIPSRAMYARAAALARTLGDRERFGRAALRNPADLGGFAHGMKADDDLIALLEEALLTLGDGSSELHARLMARLSVELFYSPFAEDRRSALADRAVALAEALGDQRVLLFTLHCREWATTGPGVPPQERLVRTAAILGLADELDDIEAMYQGRFLRFCCFLEMGEWERAEAEATEGRKIAQRLGVPGFVPWIDAWEGLRAWLQGRMTDADELAAQALTDALRLPLDPDCVFAVIGNQSVMFRYLRDLQDALLLLEPMVPLYPQFPPMAAGMALAHVQSRNMDEARRWFEQLAAKDFKDISREGSWLLTMGMLSIVAVELGDTRRAELLYEMFTPYADRWIAAVVASLGPVARCLGVLAHFLGRDDEARAHFEDALRQTSETPIPLFHAETCFNYARMLRTSEDPADRQRAAELLATSSRLADEMKLANLQRWIATLDPIA